MSIVIQTVQHPTQPIEVEAVTIHSAADLLELRESDWHDGALSLLRYPTHAPIGAIGHEPPKAFNGREVHVGDTILKGPAGDFEVIPASEWWG